jgi:Cu(I)/Ag(I) efflux system periplasmic protein CusF
MSLSKSYIAIGLALLVAGAAPAMAGLNGTEWLQRMEQARPAQANPSDGVWASVRVRNIDLAGHRLTISHGAISKIGMPAMTMTFPVEDSTHLRMLHRGDAVQIHVVNRDGQGGIVDFQMNH